mgnify:CR=1 FL=1
MYTKPTVTRTARIKVTVPIDWLAPDYPADRKRNIREGWAYLARHIQLPARVRHMQGLTATFEGWEEDDPVEEGAKIPPQQTQEPW